MTTLSAITLTTPAMLLGLGLMALPIAAHLLRRRAHRPIVFPSVALLSASSSGLSSFFRFRRWLLLLLRCLIITILVLAFARPVWLGDGVPAQASSQTQAHSPGDSVVLLIDVSTSTAQQDRGVSAVHAIHASAVKTLDTLAPGTDRANIVYAASNPDTAFPSMTTNIEAVRADLDLLSPTADRADLIGALALSGQLLAKQSGPRRLVVLTDLQASQWRDVLDRAQSPVPTSAPRLLPEGTRVIIIPLRSPPPANLALHGPTAHPRVPVVGRPVTLGVKLTNHSDQPRAVTVEMNRADDKASLASSTVTVGPREEREVSFTAAFDEPGAHGVVFSIPGDGLESDNDCYLALRVVERLPVVLVADEDPENAGPIKSGGYFIQRALAPHGDQGDRYEVSHLTSKQSSWPRLDQAAAVFIGQAGELPTPVLTSLYRYMDEGGAVVYFCGGGPVDHNLMSLDALTPQGVLPWTPDELLDTAALDHRPTIAHGNGSSSLLRRFDESSWRAFSQIRIRKRWSVRSIDKRAHTLLSFADGVPALSWRAVGTGRLYLANFSPDPAYSDLGKHGLFVALMQTLADNARPKQAPRHTGLIGQTLTFPTTDPIDPNGPTPRVIGPDGRPVVDFAASLGMGEARVTINRPSQPGFYSVKQGQREIGLAAVNIDPRESDLRRITGDQLQAALDSPGVDVRALNAADDPTGSRAQRKGLWGWALALAGALMGVEMAMVGYWQR